MRKLHTIIALCVYFLCTSQLGAQVVFSTPDLSVEPGTSIEIEVTAANFTDIVSVQFAVSWNPEVLQLDSIVHDFVLDGMQGINNEPGVHNGFEDQFGPFPSSGKLRFAWFQPSTTGQTLADGTAIFKIAFNVIGANGTSTPLNLGPDTGFPVEVINKDEQEVSVSFTNGTTVVGMVDVTNEPENADFTLMQNAPNPFTNETFINFELKNNSETTLSVFDLNGKVIFANKGNFGTGTHSINLNRDIFPSAGTYFYQLKTTDYIATKRLVVF